ncbi:MAG: ATP-binding cassette domain-containing protein [Alphaproteobacteria bacterium]|nr:ATP-binding cassette domain-containing protein [Alphaproteobacteria bacterium]
MSLLSIENAFFAYNDVPILDRVSFNINPGDKIGLVGNNGCGKSTLVKCLVGELELDNGTITRSRKVSKIGYIEQDIPKNLENETLYNVVLTALPVEERGYNSWKIDAALDAIGAPTELWTRKISELSGGWRRLALIVRTNIAAPDLLILDEPTNYLDLEKILHLENWFRDSVTCPYLLISHDRQFLDNVTKRTITLRNGKIVDHNIPYSKSREMIIKQDIMDAKKHQKEQEEINRLERAAKRMLIWDKFTTRHKPLLTRVNRIKDNLTDVHKEIRRDINLSGEKIRPNIVLNIKDFTVKTPDGKPLFHIGDLSVAKGDRIAILGPNGCGKTQFLRKLNLSDLPANIRFNPQVGIGYFDQNMDTLDKDKTIAEHLSNSTNIGDAAILIELIKAGFPYKQHGKKIGQLSFGERARFFFLLLHSLRRNFFILDEPTNHLDINGQEKLEDELLENENTCILVSHDRHFVNGVANRFLMIDRGRLRELSSPEEFYKTLGYDTKIPV